jgi:hypothetical protein
MTNTAGGDFCIAPHGSTTCGSNLSLPVDVLVENAALSGTSTPQITATQAGAGGSPFVQSITLTATSQTISSIALSNNSTTNGLPSGTSVGTLSVTMSPMAPTFSYSGSNLHLSASGTDSGGVCNATNSAGNGSFQIIDGDTLATNGTLTSGSKSICVAASEAGVAAKGQAFTITVGNRIDAAATYCAANGGGDGSSGNPWQAACIQAAINAAVNGDTVFLAAGNWQLQIANAPVVTGNKNVSVLGAGSGNTLDVFGHPSNGSGGPVGSSVTRIYTSGTNGLGGGYFTVGLYNQLGSTGCASANPGPTISHLYVDGSLTQSQGNTGGNGGINGTMSIQSCNNVTIDDIRVLQCCATNPVPSPETNFFMWSSSNNTIRNSIFTMPKIPGSNYSYAQALQTQEEGTHILDNNVFYGQSFNAIYEDNITFTRNYTFFGCDAIACSSPLGQQGYPGCSTVACWNSGNTGSHGYFMRNNYWNSANGNDMDLGGGVNDPSTEGTINDLELTGNWIFGARVAIDSCESHLYGGCVSDNGSTGAGMQVYGLTATNNTLVGSSEAHLNATGTGCGNQGVSTACATGSTYPNETMVNYSASQNYLSGPSNQYNANAYTITPSVSNNFCSGSSFGGCNTTGFTQAPTVSFTLGPLAGSVVPFNSETFTAQYGAVQWLASTSSTAPTSGDTRWRSNNANSAGNTYLPPVSLAATHGNTVYLWVMDSANHISAAASTVVP